MQEESWQSREGEGYQLQNCGRISSRLCICAASKTYEENGDLTIMQWNILLLLCLRKSALLPVLLRLGHRDTSS